MDVVGYFLALSNLQAVGGRSPDLEDVSVKIGDLGTLENYLINYPEFNVEDFKKNQINRVGDVGIYISNNFRKYLIHGEGSSNDEGVIMTFTYKIPGSLSEGGNKTPNLANHSFLIRKEGLSEEMVRRLLQKFNNQDYRHNRLVVIRGPKASTNK